MKKINILLLAAITATICFTSCAKDDINSAAENLANTQNATEETVIPTAALDAGITINYASKTTGIPPVPNSQLNFNLNTDLTEAFQETGFNIEFSSSEEIAGAYIVFKDTDGNTTGNYFDVPSYSLKNTASKSITYKRKTFLSKKISIKSEKITNDFDNVINVDFTAVPAGTFCYDICLYDSDNNVSQIKTVCTTVEAWGGNAAIVGEWVLNTITPDNIDEETIECDNGNEITVDYYQEIAYDVLFVINEDGSYSVTSEGEDLDIDYDATESSCAAVYETESYIYNQKYSGYWAFNEDNETLTFVDFKFEDFIEPLYNEEYEDGELAIEGVEVDIISSQLVFSFTDGDDDFVAYFNRK